MDPKTGTARLMELLRSHYERLDDTGEIAISPSLLASRTMDDIDSERVSPAMVSLAAHLELRQLARSICRQRVEEDEAEAESMQSLLFETQLQPRYPALRGDEEVYVLRDHLTLAERLDNIARLRKEATSKAKHADALQSETDALVALGKLSEAA